MNTARILPVILAFVCINGLCLRAAIPWKTLDESDLAATASSIDPEASAEILHNLVEIDDKAKNSTTFRYYRRIKVYDEKGVRELDKIDLIPFSEKTTIKHVSARVITPAGKIIPIGSKEFYTRELARQGRKSVNVTSFSFPQLTPGAIVEWQVETVSKDAVQPHRVNFQDSMPIRQFVLRYRAYDNYPVAPTTVAVNCQRKTFPRKRDYFFEQVRTNIPALKNEPLMPPVDEVQQWMFFYYTAPGRTPMSFFSDYFSKCDAELKTFVAAKKQNDPVRAKSEELLEGAGTDEEKLKRLHDFCRANIRHLGRETSGFTPAEIEKLAPNKTAADVLARGYGSRHDITGLFVALARAAGYDANIGLCHDRSGGKFDTNHLAVTSPSDLVAVVTLHSKKSDSESAAQGWQKESHVYDPASTFLPARELHWYNQGTKVFTIRNAYGPDNKPTPVQSWINTRNDPASANLSKRTAILRLDAEGTLAGDIRLEPQGSFAVMAKNRYSEMTPDAREQYIRDGVRERFPEAEITDIAIHNAESPLEPVSVTYRVRIPNYADVTGQRMFVQPSYFRKNLPSVFTAPTRAYDIDLDYPWAEEDYIELSLPEGFSIDSHSTPAAISGRDWFSYQTNLAYRPKTRTIIFKRNFSFKTRTIPRADYPQLKGTFDGVYAQDNMTLTLTRAE